MYECPIRNLETPLRAIKPILGYGLGGLHLRQKFVDWVVTPPPRLQTDSVNLSFNLTRIWARSATCPPSLCVVKVAWHSAGKRKMVLKR